MARQYRSVHAIPPGAFRRPVRPTLVTGNRAGAPSADRRHLPDHSRDTCHGRRDLVPCPHRRDGVHPTAGHPVSPVRYGPCPYRRDGPCRCHPVHGSCSQGHPGAARQRDPVPCPCRPDGPCCCHPAHGSCSCHRPAVRPIAGRPGRPARRAPCPFPRDGCCPMAAPPARQDSDPSPPARPACSQGRGCPCPYHRQSPPPVPAGRCPRPPCKTSSPSSSCPLLYLPYSVYRPDTRRPGLRDRPIGHGRAPPGSRPGTRLSRVTAFPKEVKKPPPGAGIGPSAACHPLRTRSDERSLCTTDRARSSDAITPSTPPHAALRRDPSGTNPIDPATSRSVFRPTHPPLFNQVTHNHVSQPLNPSIPRHALLRH